jgi:hypothetical protein
MMEIQPPAAKVNLLGGNTLDNIATPCSVILLVLLVRLA